MPHDETSSLDRTATLIWSHAGVQRELAAALAARDLRLHRMRKARLMLVITSVTLFMSGLAAGWTWATLMPLGTSSQTKVSSAQPSASTPSERASMSPGGTFNQSAYSEVTLPGAVGPTAALPTVLPGPAPTQHQDPNVIQQAASLPPVPRLINNSPLGFSELTSQYKGKTQVEASNGTYEAPAEDPQVRVDKRNKQSAVNQLSSGFKIAGVPVDGIALIQIEGGAVKAIKVGDKLPDGSVIQSANSITGEVLTINANSRK